MRLKPLFDCVAIKQDVEKHGLIVLPQTKIAQGTIVAVGPGVRTDRGDWLKLTVNVDDRVLFGEHSGQKFTLDGEEYLMMRERDVIGVLDGV
jgi:chaperonin GroES